MKKNNKLSLSSRGLRSKLNVAFYLMSVVPILVCVYIVSTYVLPRVGLQLDIAASLAISVFISIAGFYVIKEVFDRVVSVSTDVKLIAAGDMAHRVKEGPNDEVGDLGAAMNQLTESIRSNMEELKGYSEKSSEINLEIHRRVFILSDLLRISSLISHGDKLENILKFTLEKSCSLGNADLAYLFIREGGENTFSLKAKGGMSWEHLVPAKLDPEDKTFRKLIQSGEPLVLGREYDLPGAAKSAFQESFKLNCTLALPVYLKGKLIAILGIGSKKESVKYGKDDMELLELFAKQVAVALENDILAQRIHELEIIDPLTGLYNESFIRNRLEEEIRRAIVYRRPCAFMLLNIDNFQKFRDKFGPEQAEMKLKDLASLIHDSFTEVERVARVGDNEFAVVLPERNKRQAKEIAEETRRKIESAFGKEKDPDKKVTVSGGISENPLDGVNSEQLFSRAKEALHSAKSQGKNRIGVLSLKLGCP